MKFIIYTNERSQYRAEYWFDHEIHHYDKILALFERGYQKTDMICGGECLENFTEVRTYAFQEENLNPEIAKSVLEKEKELEVFNNLLVPQMQYE